jgi:3,4-dihydroxy-2-butanone 4-phosphate synthase
MMQISTLLHDLRFHRFALRFIRRRADVISAYPDHVNHAIFQFNATQPEVWQRLTPSRTIATRLKIETANASDCDEQDTVHAAASFGESDSYVPNPGQVFSARRSAGGSRRGAGNTEAGAHDDWE